MRYPDQILDSFPSSWKFFFFFLDKTQPSLSRNVPTEVPKVKSAYLTPTNKPQTMRSFNALPLTISARFTGI